MAVVHYSFSIDKIKLKMKTQRLARFKSYPSVHAYFVFNKLPNTYEILTENYNDMRPYHYRDSWTLRVKGETEGALYLAAWYNGSYTEGREQPHQVLIEYNPNKSGQMIYDFLKGTFFLKLLDILSCDLAFDIKGASRADCLIRTACDVMTYGKLANNTLYISPKQEHSGRVKVYQKDTERKEKGMDLEKTLRIEVSIKSDILSAHAVVGSTPTYTDRAEIALLRCCEHLNAVYVKTVAEQSEDWKVYALSQLSPDALTRCLSMMTAPTKRRYSREVLASSYENLNLDTPTLWITLWKSLERWCA